MALPPLLKTELQKAHQVLLDDLGHSLTPRQRYRIYRALESFDDDSTQSLRDHISSRRIKLDILSIQKVLPLWTGFFPHDTLLPRAMKVMEDSLSGLTTRELVKETWRSVNDESEDIAYGDQSHRFQRRVRILVAVRRCLEEIWVKGDAFAHAMEVDFKDQSPIALDSWTSDAVQWAADAYRDNESGGFDQNRSLEFWIWWLDEAVPAAWRVFPD